VIAGFLPYLLKVYSGGKEKRLTDGAAIDM
jgi:hypothetical protein